MLYAKIRQNCKLLQTMNDLVELLIIVKDWHTWSQSYIMLKANMQSLSWCIEMVHSFLINFQVPPIIIVHPEAPPPQLLPLHMTATSYHGNQIRRHAHGLGLHILPVWAVQLIGQSGFMRSHDEEQTNQEQKHLDDNSAIHTRDEGKLIKMNNKCISHELRVNMIFKMYNGINICFYNTFIFCPLIYIHRHSYLKWFFLLVWIDTEMNNIAVLQT